MQLFLSLADQGSFTTQNTWHVFMFLLLDLFIFPSLPHLYETRLLWHTYYGIKWALFNILNYNATLDFVWNNEILYYVINWIIRLNTVYTHNCTEM